MLEITERESLIEEAADRAIKKITSFLKEERESVINETIERVFLKAPEVIGNLVANHVAMNKINSQFYKDHPEFKDHKMTVAKVLECVEGKNPLLDHKNLLTKAVPEIRERIKITENLDMESVSPNPNRNFEPLNTSKIDQHGEL